MNYSQFEKPFMPFQDILRHRHFSLHGQKGENAKMQKLEINRMNKNLSCDAIDYYYCELYYS